MLDLTTTVSHEYSVHQAFIGLQLELLIPLFLHDFLSLHLFDFPKFFLSSHVSLSFLGHFLPNFKVLKFFDLFLYCVVFYLLKYVLLHIVFVVVHPGSLLPR